MTITVCAVIDPNTNLVVNTIMADVDTDDPIPGFLLVAVPDGFPVDNTCSFNPNATGGPTGGPTGGLNQNTAQFNDSNGVPITGLSTGIPSIPPA